MLKSSTGVFCVWAWLLIASVPVTDACGNFPKPADEAYYCEKTRAWLTCVPTTGVIVTERYGCLNWPAFIFFGRLFNFRGG